MNKHNIKLKHSVGQIISDFGAFIALALLVIILSLIEPGFRTVNNFMSLLRQASFNGLIAFGMTLVILSGGIDLSVGSVFALTSIICAELLTLGTPVLIAVLSSLIIGTLLGTISGLLVTKGRLQPFIATLIAMTAYRGLAKIFTDGKPISQLASSVNGSSFLFKSLGKGNILLFDTIRIPIPVIVLSLIFVLVFFLLTKTTFGRNIYATGSNARCAALAGVDTSKIKIYCYAISGLLAALAGLLMISRLDSAQPTLGESYELDAIAAVALGGTSMSGGRGKITGTIAGVLIIAVLNNGLGIMDVAPYYQEVIKAAVILVAVLSDRKR